MPSISSDARFLGVDLKAFWLELRQSWQQLHQLPLVSWLTPDPSVRLLQADGGHSIWCGDVGSGKAPVEASSAIFAAIELPPERVLQRSLHMPAAMPATDIGGTHFQSFCGARLGMGLPGASTQARYLPSGHGIGLAATDCAVPG